MQGISAKSLFQFARPVSPHIAARENGNVCLYRRCFASVTDRVFQEPPTDAEVVSKVHDELHSYASEGEGTVLVETAGGVLSPSPSGSLQADLYRPLRLPVILVGDHRLGGIGTTISAYESLHMRGYDVQAIVMLKTYAYRNHNYLFSHFRGYIPLKALDKPPRRDNDKNVDLQNMHAYYNKVGTSSDMDFFLRNIDFKHKQRIEQLNSLAGRAHDSIWYPFTQHQGRSKQDILTIDSAFDDTFQVLKSSSPSQSKDVSSAGSLGSMLQPAVDGSSSWWTQGLGHGNSQLALTAAHAAGRYGHVMFAGAAHEPAVSLVQTLIKKLRNPRLKKGFYTDNGSTGMEVAVKMALRASAVRYGWDSTKDEIAILGLKGSYHGDTMGVMDCSEPSTFNKKVEWYRGRGYWFDFPTVKMRQGQWMVDPPADMKEFGDPKVFDSLDDIFDVKGRDDTVYRQYIAKTIEHLVSTLR